MREGRADWCFLVLAKQSVVRYCETDTRRKVAVGGRELQVRPRAVSYVLVKEAFC